MIHADHKLASRLEGLICAEYRRLAEVGGRVLPYAGAEAIDVAGGVALWLGKDSPVNGAVGLGMAGPVDDAEVVRLEAFYRQRGAPAVTSICPLADPSVLDALGRRGWRPTQFEHVLAVELAGRPHSGEFPPEPRGCFAPGASGAPGPSREIFSEVRIPEVRVCTDQERETWAHLATLGFADGQPSTPAHEEFGRIMAAREDGMLVMGWVDGEPAGTGALVIQGGVGWLSGDSTVPRFRRRGVQQAIQRYRLRLAREAGCELAVTEAAPGGASQRNMERLGFRIVFTHVEFVKSL